MKEKRFLDAIDAPIRVDLQIARVPVVIDVNTRRLERIVRRYFAPFVVDKLDGGATLHITGLQGEPVYDASRMPSIARMARMPKICFYDRDDLRVIRKNRTGCVHYIWGQHFVAVGDLLKYPQQLLNLVSTAYSHRLRQDGYLALHASSVAGPAGALAFAGQSGSGKSSISLALMDYGYDYASNDRTFFRRAEGPVILAAGVPKWPRVNPGTLLANRRLRGLLPRDKREYYSGIQPRELWSVEDKHDVQVENIYGKGRLALHSQLRTLYVLNWSHRPAPLRLREVSGDRVAETLSAFYKTDVYDPPSQSTPSPVDLHFAFQGAQVVEVTGGIDIPRLLKEVVTSEGQGLASTA